MSETYRTANLFGADLPDMPADAPGFRFHYADMSEMPMSVTRPAGAWDDTAWDGSNAFRGGTAANAVTLARQGWPNGAERARALHDGIQAAMPSRPTLGRFDVAGAVPSIPRALAGNPLHMRRMVRKETAQRPIVSLVCSICVPASYPANGLIAHAAAVAGAVDFLETAGFRCNVLVAARFRDSAINGEVAVQLKAPEQPLNLAVVAYGLGHPSFLRRIVFGVLQADLCMAPIGQGLGMATDLEALPDAGTFTIRRASNEPSGRSAADRFRKILRQLAEQGCPGIPQDVD